VDQQQTRHVTPGVEDVLRSRADLKQAHDHRAYAAELRLPAFVDVGTSLYGKLALSRFALHAPEKYFDRSVASAVLGTLESYAREDSTLLTTILEELRPKLDAGFEHLAAINAESDDGRWPDDEVDRLKLIDTRFLFRHLRLLEYVLDFLALPIVAFHCERRGVKWRDPKFRTKSRLEEHLPNTPARLLAAHWSAVVRNAIAHGGVSFQMGELEFRDDHGQTEPRGHYEFVRSTDQLQDACNASALAYTAFFLRLAALGVPTDIPLGVAREVLHGFVDRPSCWVEHVAVLVRASGPQLHVYLRHGFTTSTKLMHEAYRAALVGLDLMPQADLFGVHMASPATGVSFFYFERKHLAAYAAQEITLQELLRRVSEKPMQYWDTNLPARRAASRARSVFQVLRASWPGFLHQRREQARARGQMPVDIIEVEDISVGGEKRRKAAVSIDALPAHSVGLTLKVFERIARAVNRARVPVSGHGHRGARRWGACDYLQVQVYSHEVRPRTPRGNQFAPPYFFTLEYARRGDFLLKALWEHTREAVGRFRYWLPKKPEGASRSSGG